MTIRMPPLSLGDRLLRILGKRRAVFVPAGAYEKFGPYVTLRATKESFFRALLRRRREPLPAGTIDFFDDIDVSS